MRGGRTGVVAWASLALFCVCACASSPEGGTAAKRKEARRRTVILTSKDDVRVGREGAEQVAAEIGTFDDPELEAYVAGIGKKLVRALPSRSFAYSFKIVDQMEPNAFALPGGR